ncbi:MAG: hypothetical protein JNN28_08200 [Saprospiraceae bacterium]|nr:hypothetical protein [Saprospiraceae bacterium]
MSTKFHLQFPSLEIPVLAQHFGYPVKENKLYDLRAGIAKRGFLTLEELKVVCRWKSVRSQSRVAKNTAADVEAITKVCFETKNERLRIGSLLLLEGVQYPTASVLLHFFHPDPYPILDVRALESLGIQKPPAYDFGFWSQYVAFTRQLAKESSVDMRTLDKALWQWSKNVKKII